MKKPHLLSAVLLVFFLAGCGNSTEEIHRQISEANFCETKEDCVNVGSKCPFGCYIYVHQSEAERIGNLVDGFKSDCVYGCIRCPDVACLSNTCQAVCE